MRCPECKSGRLCVTTQVPTDIYLQYGKGLENPVLGIEHTDWTFDPHDFCLCMDCEYGDVVSLFRTASPNPTTAVYNDYC